MTNATMINTISLGVMIGRMGAMINVGTTDGMIGAIPCAGIPETDLMITIKVTATEMTLTTGKTTAETLIVEILTGANTMVTAATHLERIHMDLGTAKTTGAITITVATTAMIIAMTTENSRTTNTAISFLTKFKS